MKTTLNLLEDKLENLWHDEKHVFMREAYRRLFEDIQDYKKIEENQIIEILTIGSKNTFINKYGSISEFRNPRLIFNELFKNENKK